jgi:hypothetical protein
MGNGPEASRSVLVDVEDNADRVRRSFKLRSVARDFDFQRTTFHKLSKFAKIFIYPIDIHDNVFRFLF